MRKFFSGIVDTAAKQIWFLWIHENVKYIHVASQMELFRLAANHAAMPKTEFP